jgi:hypothetical protein
VITGERDVADVQAQLLRHDITGARSLTLPGVGHMSNMGR